MARYRYRGFDATGSRVAGESEAESLDLAREDLTRRGVLLAELAPAVEGRDWRATLGLTSDRVGLDELDVIAVGVANERHRHRPLLEPHRRRARVGAGGDRALVEARAIVGVHVELPQRVAVVDRPTVLVLARELDAPAAVAREHDLAHVRQFDAVRHREAERLFVEAHGTLQVAHVDAELVEAGLHVVLRLSDVGLKRVSQNPARVRTPPVGAGHARDGALRDRTWSRAWPAPTRQCVVRNRLFSGPMRAAIGASAARSKP